MFLSSSGSSKSYSSTWRPKPSHLAAGNVLYYHTKLNYSSLTRKRSVLSLPGCPRLLTLWDVCRFPAQATHCHCHCTQRAASHRGGDTRHWGHLDVNCEETNVCWYFHIKRMISLTGALWPYIVQIWLMKTVARIQSLLISELQSQELWQQIKISDHFLKYPPNQSEWVILVTWVSQLKESHIGHQAVSGIGRVWSQSRPTISGAGERRGGLQDSRHAATHSQSAPTQRQSLREIQPFTSWVNS